MKKVMCIVLILFLCWGLVAFLSGCNKQVFDTTWSFERAIIFLPDGEKIEGPVTSWTDYDGSDMIQVCINDKMYLTHSTNVILISE